MNLPAPREPSGTSGLVPFKPRVDAAEESRVAQLVPMLKRGKWLILGCTALAGTGAAIYARQAEPVYGASVSLRIAAKQPNAPEVWRAFSQPGDVSTEMEVSGSRTLIEEATRALGLQVRLTKPRASHVIECWKTSGCSGRRSCGIPSGEAGQRQLRSH